MNFPYVDTCESLCHWLTSTKLIIWTHSKQITQSSTHNFDSCPPTLVYIFLATRNHEIVGVHNQTNHRTTSQNDNERVNGSIFSASQRPTRLLLSIAMYPPAPKRTNDRASESVPHISMFAPTKQGSRQGHPRNGMEHRIRFYNKKLNSSLLWNVYTLKHWMVLPPPCSASHDRHTRTPPPPGKLLSHGIISSVLPGMNGMRVFEFRQRPPRRTTAAMAILVEGGWHGRTRTFLGQGKKRISGKSNMVGQVFSEWRWKN